uniref:Uncharacterized protein n=1 Tax=Oryza barthii TaxID=65489 RepID=A0A0D3HVF4_9ORYZ
MESTEIAPKPDPYKQHKAQLYPRLQDLGREGSGLHTVFLSLLSFPIVFFLSLATSRGAVRVAQRGQAQLGRHETGTVAAGEGAARLRRASSGDHGAWRRGGERRGRAAMAELGLQVARTNGVIYDRFDECVRIDSVQGFHFTHEMAKRSSGMACPRGARQRHNGGRASTATGASRQN